MKTVHIVDRSAGGQKVGCPVGRRDVEADECLACTRLVRASLGATVPTIVCEVRVPTWGEVGGERLPVPA